MGSLLSLLVINIFIVHSEKPAMDTAELKPRTWLLYADDTFVIWPYRQASLKEFLQHINNPRPTIKFTMEVETSNTLPFLDVLMMKWDSNLFTYVYRNTLMQDIIYISNVFTSSM